MPLHWGPIQHGYARKSFNVNTLSRAGGVKHHKILLVEDNMINLALIEVIIAGGGLEQLIYKEIH